ncbi:hypothetical protein CK203_050693 [Vitis vinifera]|uniref:Uncharacterized protein n=1 Tax=Vitis vinifera TaxID=29760 RepID=A0A438H8C9_VITVI|nr:hypothetical protein CK203_050693 [Vitis vinifera]
MEAIGLDEVQSHILGKEPLPSTREVFLDVRRDKSENIVMMGKNPIGVSTENSTLNTTTLETAAAVTNQNCSRTLQQNSALNTHDYRNCSCCNQSKNCSKRLKIRAMIGMISAISLNIQGLLAGNYMANLQTGKVTNLETK